MAEEREARGTARRRRGWWWFRPYEDEKAAAADPRRTEAETGPVVLENGGLYNAIEVSSSCFTSTFQDL